MASMLHGGERELNLFTAGEPPPSMLQYMREQANQIGQYIQQTGNTFAQGVVNAYETYYSDTALRHAQAALTKVKTFFMADKICALDNVYDIQQATPVMQRFVMAEPTYRKLYHEGRCSGYDGSYVDPFPGKIGDQDYNYRRAVNGLLQLDKPTAEAPYGNHRFQIYIEELMEGDRELTIHDQTPIMHTWATLRFSLAHSLMDPGSKTGDLL